MVRTCLSLVYIARALAALGIGAVLAPNALWAQSERPGRVFRDCPGCPQMVVIPAGRFRMGVAVRVEGPDDNNGPQRTVTVAKPFAMGRYEVTRAQYAAFVAATRRVHRDACYMRVVKDWKFENEEGWRKPGFPQSDRDPVVCVSWHDATAYAAWLAKTTGKAYRLPNEAEWEYAARAGTTTPFSWGTTLGKNRANCVGCGSRWDDKRTAPVGSFAGNPWMVYDMHGNALEWVQDCDSGDYSGLPADSRPNLTKGNCNLRILRGGSWASLPADLDVTARDPKRRELRISNFGFRVARTLP
jgi:formylglycine-generating enzyme required for sulfatase activity